MKKRPPAVSFESILLYTIVFSLTKQDQALKIPSAIDQIKNFTTKKFSEVKVFSFRNGTEKRKSFPHSTNKLKNQKQWNTEGQPSECNRYLKKNKKKKYKNHWTTLTTCPRCLSKALCERYRRHEVTPLKRVTCKWSSSQKPKKCKFSSPVPLSSSHREPHSEGAGRATATMLVQERSKPIQNCCFNESPWAWAHIADTCWIRYIKKTLLINNGWIFSVVLFTLALFPILWAYLELNSIWGILFLSRTWVNPTLLESKVTVLFIL